MTNDIFDLDGDLAIDCTPLEVDMEALTIERLLYQFQNSDIMLDLGSTLAAMEQETYRAAIW